MGTRVVGMGARGAGICETEEEEEEEGRGDWGGRERPFEIYNRI